jgi:general secretion pathway protein J
MLNKLDQRGFTLIEVLIAMTLLGMMVVLLFTSMKICAESWQKGEDKIDDVNDVAAVYQFFQHHLTEARPLWDDFSEENKLLSFQGENQALQFVSAFPASAKKAGLQVFSLKLVNDGAEKIILVSIKPFFPATDGEEWRKEEVTLLRHVSNFSIQYFTKDESEPSGYWQDNWLNMEFLPSLVKIKIERDDGRFWPEMTIALKTIGNNQDGGQDPFIDGNGINNGQGLADPEFGNLQ